jgi:hypothetical protein
MLNQLRRAARAGGRNHHLRGHRLELPPLGAGIGCDRQRVVDGNPVAEFTAQVARVLGEERHGNMLTATRGSDDDERLQSLGPRDDAHGPHAVERRFEFRDRGSEGGVVDRTAGITSGPGHDGGAIRKLAGDLRDRERETVFSRRVSEMASERLRVGVHLKLASSKVPPAPMIRNDSEKGTFSVGLARAEKG